MLSITLYLMYRVSEQYKPSLFWSISFSLDYVAKKRVKGMSLNSITNRAFEKIFARRSIALGLMILGGLLLFLAPETKIGTVLFLTGLVIEALGIYMDHSTGNN